jgi:hypothetical protein
MGGSSSSNKKPAATETAQPTMPTMMTFGQEGISPDVTSQLQAGGLLGVSQPANMYQQFQVPILRTPSDIDAYLKGMGKKPITASNVGDLKAVTAAGTPVAKSSSSGGSSSGKGSSSNISVSSWLERVQRGSDR